MEDEDRSFLMSRVGSPGSSMAQLINMAFEGNVNNVQVWRQPELEAETTEEGD